MQRQFHPHAAAPVIRAIHFDRTAERAQNGDAAAALLVMHRGQMHVDRRECGAFVGDDEHRFAGGDGQIDFNLVPVAVIDRVADDLARGKFS